MPKAFCIDYRGIGLLGDQKCWSRNCQNKKRTPSSARTFLIRYPLSCILLRSPLLLPPFFPRFPHRIFCTGELRHPVAGHFAVAAPARVRRAAIAVPIMARTNAEMIQQQVSTADPMRSFPLSITITITPTMPVKRIRQIPRSGLLRPMSPTPPHYDQKPRNSTHPKQMASRSSLCWSKENVGKHTTVNQQ